MLDVLSGLSFDSGFNFIIRKNSTFFALAMSLTEKRQTSQRAGGGQ